MNTRTSTGRRSRLSPDLQNIPIRTEQGGSIRQSFSPADDTLLKHVDYSQIELRVLAHLKARQAT